MPQPEAVDRDDEFRVAVRLARQRFNNTKSAYMAAVESLNRLRKVCPHKETDRLRQGMTSLRTCALCGEVLS